MRREGSPPARARRCGAGSRTARRESPREAWSRRGGTPSEQAALLAALEPLPQPERDTIKWHHRDGEPFGKVADRLGIPIEEAQRLWCRALQRLQRSLGSDDDG
ncbi:MAG: hypothetical protein U0790_23540 [Isosphaeraceae bacterium]